jgi:dolichyl-phosphate-mannose-protein mannosyltransferase
MSQVPSFGKLTEDYSSSYEFETKDKREQSKLPKSGGLLAFLSNSDKQWLLYLTVLSFVVRLAFLNHPSVVIFDEVHFGGFAQKYLSGEFFTDLHPPLARLLVTLSAWVGGFDAKFTFYDIGADYLKANVPYITMRAFTAVCGAVVAPIAYATMRAMGISLYTTVAVSTMIIFENGLATQSRLILLDSYLVLFTTLIGFFWVLFQNQRSRPFSTEWYGALIGLGSSMALAASCKWVGLFAVIALGLFTIVDLWNTLGDVKIPLKTVGKHFAVRVVALILLPIAIYAATFWVHFALLSFYSPSAASMSLEFQQTLIGGQLPPTMAPIFYGSTIRLRQYRGNGAYLHSHNHVYPTGSKQQQVTGYHHRDQNNLWVVRRPFVVNKTYIEEEATEESELQILRHNDPIRLNHVVTNRFLHGHNVEPPVSNKEKQHEVSCYGHHNSNFSDTNDNWRIEIVDDYGQSITKDVDDEQEEKEKPKYKVPIMAIGTKFRLVHVNLGCRLHSRNKPLPDWGYKQAEVTCSRETLRTNSIFIVESNEHPAADDSTARIQLPMKGFWGKFLELNKLMWDSNAGLSADHPFGSRPPIWPFLSRGIGFWNGNHVPKTYNQYKKSKDRKPESDGENDENAAEGKGANNEDDAEDKVEQARLAEEYNKFKGQQMYLLGNPVLWWSSTAAIAIYMALVFFKRAALRRKLAIGVKMQASPIGKQLEFFSFSGFMFIQWLWHYIPFFGMRRQLFLHHYLPALYFAVLLFAILVDFALAGLTSMLKLSERNAHIARMTFLGVYVLASIYVFWRLAPLGYGLRMSKSQCEALKWLKRWDFDCGSLVDPVSQAILTNTAGS